MILAVALGLVPATSPQDPEPGDGTFVLLPGEHEIGTILEDAARFLGRNHVFDLSRRRNKMTTVRLQNTLQLDATGCEEVVSQLALSTGLVMTPLDEVRGVYEWVDALGGSSDHGKIIARAWSMSPAEVERRQAWKVCVQTTVALEHMSPTLAAKGLERALARASRPVPFQATAVGGSVVLVGLTHTVAQALRILRQTDVEGAEAVETDARVGTLEERVDALDERIEQVAKQKKKE